MKRMIGGQKFLKWLIPLVAILHRVASPNSASAARDFSFLDGNMIYNYTLTSPVRDFPHGVRREDGYYEVAANETILWFQLCDGMIFNHDPPTCADCWDCGGPTRGGMDCTALVANNIGGYHVCTTIRRGPKIDIDIFDKKNPHSGVIVKMSSNSPKSNCSLSVSVLCYSNGVEGPHSPERLGTCNYATELRHPSGCAVILNVHGRGWGWFVTLITIISTGWHTLSALLQFFLGIRGIDSPSLPSQELREMRASNLLWGFTVIWTEVYVHLPYFRLSPIWTSGQPCPEEPRVFVLLWRGSSRDLLKVTGAHILL